MSRARDNDGFWAGLWSDPWRKLLSIALAVGLWYWVDGYVSESKEFPACALRLADPAGGVRAGDAPLGSSVDILVSPQEFAVKSFLDASGSGAPVTQVSLSFVGGKSTIAILGSILRATVDPSDRLHRNTPTPFFEFEAADLQLRDGLERATVRMVPARIRVELEPLETFELQPTPDLLQILFPASDPSLSARLDRQAATFSPESITVTGSASDVRALERQLDTPRADAPTEPLFSVDLTSWAGTTHRAIRQVAAVHVYWTQTRRLRFEPPRVEVEFPVRPAYQSFELSVPVELLTFQTEYDADQFEPIEDAKITLLVASPLDAELAGKQGAALQEWVRHNLCILAVLPADATPGQPTVIQGRLWFPDGRFVEGTHYRSPVVPLEAHFKDSGGQ